MVLALGILFGGLSACRIKSPTLAEQQALSAKGALNAKDSWVAAPIQRGQMVNDPVAAGIPDYTSGGSTPLDNLSAQIQPSTNAEGDSEASERTVATVGSSANTPSVNEVKDESPLDKIARACPGSEKEVTDALKTLDRNSRINKYQVLTGRCPASSNLWDWLGVDYLQSGKIEEAKDCFQKAVLLDNSNQDAKGHLAEAQRKIAESMRPTN